ncbi:hypothetical protein IAQ61_001504 [Plenodomus lingam]|uniref:uncharacterized protein n=1 Tax=Leptosphaeria maculans TaxID=5022 RepID=UPI00331CBBAE|nr:hypothetical protein IAQ61_001504 [Plenodomus lingam]
MHVTHSLQALAVVLSFTGPVEALVVRKSNKPAQEVYRAAHRGPAPEGHLYKRQNATDVVLDCSNDRWQELLDSNTGDRITTFCNEWLDIPPATSVLEVTPTITITTSAHSTTSFTSTTRIITTETVTETATSTLAPVARRAANIAAIVEDVIESVIESGSAVATSSKSPQRIQAESGLSNACSCKMVDPTATVTSSFTVPPVYTTVGVRKVYVVKRTDTKIFTSTTTVIISASVSPTSTSDTDVSVSQTSDASITAAPPATRLTGTDLPASSPVSSGNPVVTAIPFTCPDDAGKRVDQVVGGYRLDYLVLCNTEAVTQDRIGFPIAVDSGTACTAQCSLVNAQSGQDTCQAASFEPYTDGRSGGLCILSGSDPSYVDKEGSVAVVHTGTFANGDECQALNSSVTNTSVDTSALISSITAAPFSLSTPGLVTETANGGVFQTYVSANSTDAQGYVHWSWYAVSASSSYWWAVYSTSWECTKTLTRTIVTLPSEPMTITSVLVTTIINGGVTTIISGTSTEIITNGGGGVAPPTFVPASTTNANGEFTTFFSLATMTSTDGNGLIPPTGVPSSIQIAGNATVSGSTATFFSTADSGVIPPSRSSPGEEITIVSTGGTVISTSGSTFTSNFNGSEGVIPPVSTIRGSAAFSLSGSTFAAESTGDSGIITPSINTPASSLASQTIQEFSNSTIRSTGSLAFTISGSTAIASSTGDSGVIPPAPSANVSIIVTRTVISGVASFVTSRSTLVSDNTEDSGIVPPSRTLGTVTVTETVTSGVATFATSDNAIAFSSTGSSGVIPPAPSGNSSVTLSVTVNSGVASFATSRSTFTSTGTGDSGIIPPNSRSVVVSTSTAGGSGNATFSGGTAIVSSTGDDGVIPPPLTSIPSGSSGSVRSSRPVSTPSSDDGGPPLTRDVTITVTTTVGPSTQVPSIQTPSSLQTPSVNITSAGGSNGVTIQFSTAAGSSTGDNGVVPPAITSVPVSNSTSTGPVFTNSGGDRTGRYSESTSVRGTGGSSGVITPSSNSTMSAPPSMTPTASTNSTSTGPPFSNTDDLRSGSYSLSSSSIVINSFGSSGVITPSSNASITSVPTVTPTSGLNSTSTGPPFSNTDDLRSGSYSLSSSSIVINSFGSSGVITPSSNASITSVPTVTPTSGSNTTSSGPPFSNTDDLRSGSYSLSSSLVSINSFGSSGVITPSTNASITSQPTVTPTSGLNSTSTGPPFSNTDDLRSGSYSISSSLVSINSFGSSGVITPSSNVSITSVPTVTPTPGLNTTSTGPPFSNTDNLRSGTYSLSSSIGFNSTQSGTGSIGSVTTPPSQQTTLVVLTATVVIPHNSANISSSNTPPSLLTPSSRISSSVPTPSTNSTISLPTAASSSLPPTFVNSTRSTFPSSSSGIFTEVTRISNTTTAPTGGVTSVPAIGNSTTIRVLTVTTSSNFTNIPSLTPSASLNITTTTFFGSSSIPSATPTISLNITTSVSICPTAPLVVTVTAIETSVRVETTTLVQTVTAGASSTVSEAAPAASSFTPLDLVARFREEDDPATQAQIDSACADSDNIVLNPNFAIGADSSVPNWSVDGTDRTITVGSEPAPSGNGTIAQFKSAVVGRTLTITQPLTLCPGQQYEISALARQAHKEAECTVQYVVGNDTVATVEPAESWLEESFFFTAREGVAGASATLEITASCQGWEGIPVADQEGWMRVEVSGVRVVQDAGARKMKRMMRMMRMGRRGAAEKQRAEQQGYAVLLFSEEG